MSNTEKTFARKEIEAMLRLISIEYSLSGELPSDKDINILGNLFYTRDKFGDPDVEMLACMRGLIQGMQLMKQMIKNKQNNENKK